MPAMKKRIRNSGPNPAAKKTACKSPRENICLLDVQTEVDMPKERIFFENRDREPDIDEPAANKSEIKYSQSMLERISWNAQQFFEKEPESWSEVDPRSAWFCLL
jgi:hypothetical protein